MINKKRVNKVTKLTVASAIAFSALAQPLGTLVTVKAAEAPATTKAENKLLQSTTSNENASKNLKSSLKASKVLLENPNFTFDAAARIVPGWSIGYRNSILENARLIKDLSLSPGPNGFYDAIVDNSGRTFRVCPGYPVGLAVRLEYPTQKPVYATVCQNVKTVPGAEYTFGFSVQGAAGNAEEAIRVSDNETIIASTPFTHTVETGTRNYSATFTARSTETRVEIVVAGRTNVSNLGTTYAGTLLNASLTPTNTTAPDAPNVTTVYNTDTTIKGNGEANCDVKVTLESGDVVTGRTDASGNFNITIPAQATGKQIKVTLTNELGNESDPTTVTVLAKSVTPPTINPVTSDDVVVKGTGTPGQRVYYKVGNSGWGDYSYATVGTDGTYMFYITNQQAGTLISVKHTVGGIDSTVATTTVIQGSVAAPTINGVKSDDTTVKGTGIPGATVTVTIAGQDRTATVGQDGNYSVTIPAQAVGTVITAKQTLNGKTSDPVSTTVTQGTVAAPTIDAVTTDDTTVKGTGLAGATVTVTIAGQERTATVGQDGNYSVIIPAQAFGTAISVKQTLNGQTSSDATTTVIQGTVAAPTINGVKSDDTTVKGTGIAGATVTVTIAGQDRTATVGQDGNYSVTIPAQAVGTVITAKQTLNGKTSDSVSTTVTQGTVAAPTIGAVTTDDEKVTGTGINGATVTVKVGNQEYTATVENDRYSIDIAKQPVGTEITAKQTLNGETSSSVSTTVTQGTVAAPTISAVTTDDDTVKGTGINGATVKVTVGGQEYPATVTDGKYSVTIPKQAFGTEITATQTLNGKTSSDVKTTVTQGTVAPPTINPVTTDDEIVKGTGINGATVTVMIGNQEYPATVTNNEYSVAVPKQPSGTIISAKQTLNGKTSDLATTTVGQGTVAAPTINSLTSDDVMARGTGISGAVVTITIGTHTYTGTVINGNYAIEIPKQAAGTVVYAKQTLFGQTSTDAQTTVTQGSVSVPTINTVTTDSTTVTGSGINGATVTVKIGNQEYPATVANGSYSVTIPKQAFGTEITAKQSLGGKTSDAASTTVTQGTVANPTINAVTSNDTIVTGSGITGATVTLSIGGQDYPGTVTNGAYSITIPKQAAGTEIKAKQSLNGQTSGSVSTIVTQGTLAAPTINDYTVGDGYVTGSAPAGASKVALYVGDQLIRYAPVTDGKYRVYAGDNAAMGVAGTAFQVAGVDAAGGIGAKASSTVKPSATVAAPTINDFYARDAYAKGTATGASKVTLYVNNVAVRTATVAADGSYSIYTGDQASLATAGNTFQVQATNAAGKTSTKTTATVKEKLAAPTINDYYAGDAYAKGIAAGASKVTLYVNNVAVRTATVAADGSYSIYTGDQASLTTAGNTFQVQSTSAAGTTSTKTTGTVKAKTVVTAPTIKDYYVGDAYAKGIAAGASKVTLYVNNVAVRTAAVAADGSYSIYAGDQPSLATAGNTFQVQSTTASGATSTKTTATVKEKVVAPTINDFYAGDAYAKGIAAGASK
ncbi:beta strand repeat-containing protein, partial [Listeria booriae]